jgi:hypothetical protein
VRKFLDGAVIAAAIGFVAILALSAVYDHTIIWLHAFQALMYLAVIGLILRRNRLGYFLGASIAALWNYTNLFVTSFFRNGLKALDHLISTGQVTHADQLIAVAAVAFHFVLLGGGLALIVRTSRGAGADIVRFLAVFVASTAYFVADIALFQPRYLTIFPRLLHPHGLF